MRARAAALWRDDDFRRTALGLAALFLVALALRLAWIHYVDPSPRDGRFDDSLWYDITGQTIAAGDGYLYFDGKPTAAWPVGYPAFVAGIYKVTGNSVLTVKLVNAFIGALTVVGVYLLGRKVFGARAGWAAAGIIAFMPNQVFFTTLVMSEVLASFLLLSIALVVLYWTLDADRRQWPAAALAGALTGLLALVRGEYLLVLVVPVVVWFVALRDRRKAATYGATALVALALVLTPWTVRNWVRLDYPVVVSTGAVANLLAGHWEGANGGGTFEAGAPIVAKYLHLPNPEREIVTYKEHIREAFSWAIRHPWEELQLIPRRLYHLYRSDDSAVQWTQNHPVLSQERFEWFQTLSNAYYYVVGGWVLLSAAAWWRLRDPGRLLLLLMVAYVSFMFGVVFVGDPRYHFTIMPAWAVLAAPAVVGVWESVRPGRAPPRTAAEIEQA